MSSLDKDNVPDDAKFMAVAIAHGQRGLGRTAPNPSVGCVLVKDGKIIAAGTTADGGRPHAEVKALAMAGEKSSDTTKGATAYVTLEPCSHTGATGPCTDALIQAGIARVVIGQQDPFAKVNGQGIKLLTDAGIEVQVGILAQECASLHRGFILTQLEHRPLYTLKIASSLDSKTAMASGESQWITGPQARRIGHQLRATHDAIMVGVGTVLSDDPKLDCRIAGLEARSPKRIIMDRHLRTPMDSQLIQSAHKIPVYLVSEQSAADRDYPEGVHLVSVSDMDNLQAVSAQLCQLGFTRILVEGGATLHSSFIHQDLVDELYWFRAPFVIGGEGLSAVTALDLDHLSDCTKYEKAEIRQIGDDLLERFIRRG